MASEQHVQGCGRHAKQENTLCKGRACLRDTLSVGITLRLASIFTLHIADSEPRRNLNSLQTSCSTTKNGNAQIREIALSYLSSHLQSPCTSLAGGRCLSSDNGYLKTACIVQAPHANNNEQAIASKQERGSTSKQAIESEREQTSQQQAIRSKEALASKQ